MAVSNAPWGDVSESDYASAGDFCDACLVNLNDGPRSRWSKSKCKLPVRMPRTGALNRGGVHAAAAALAGARGGVQAPPDVKRAAARKLISLYRELDEDPPEAVRQLAR